MAHYYNFIYIVQICGSLQWQEISGYQAESIKRLLDMLDNRQKESSTNPPANGSGILAYPNPAGLTTCTTPVPAARMPKKKPSDPS